MSENQKRVLQMLAEGKISVEEASRLLSLINEENSSGVERAAVAKKPNHRQIPLRGKPKEGS
jgi:hypothetical protein